MADQWRYRAGGMDHGPFSVEEMKERALRGDLGPDDLVWPDGGRSEEGMSAEQAIDFSTLAAAATPAVLPDWLEDVEAAAQEAPHQESAAAESIPAWLQELIEQGVEEVRGDGPPGIEEEAVSSAESPSEEVESAAAAFLFETPQEEPPPSAAEAPAGEIAVEPEPPAKKPESSRRRIETAQEAWHRARVALDRWIDLDANRDRVLAGDIEALQQDPDVLELLEPLQNFGPVMVDRLIQHLTFLAENRRKYYQALAKLDQRGDHSG